VKRLYLRKETSPLAKFSSGHQQRNTRLEQGKTYKYLGTEESDGIHHQQMKERLKKEYTRRLGMILKSELNAKKNILQQLEY
jgi:hypothetical protein